MAALEDTLNFFEEAHMFQRHRPKSIALDQKIGHRFGPRDAHIPHVVPWSHYARRQSRAYPMVEPPDRVCHLDPRLRPSRRASTNSTIDAQNNLRCRSSGWDSMVI